MTVRHLRFKSFRNLEDADFYPTGNVNVLFGRNAQGKTNLMEAIWLFTGSRSFRGAKDADLVKIGRDRGRLSLEFSSAGASQTADLEIDGGRKAGLNGTALESPVRLAGEFCAVIFSPEHLGLVKEGPTVRRKFIDAAVCQLFPRHFAVVSEYRKSLIQRNALLKDIPNHAELVDTLDIWEEKLCAAGAAVIFTRLRYLRRLEESACTFYDKISSGAEKLTIRYLSPEIPPDIDLSDAASSRKQIAQALAKAMKSQRAGDIACGYTRTGPHRDDIEFFLDGLTAKTFGSQGQQRSVVLALKLAEAEILSAALSDPPVLLLDDVLSELDRERQKFLLSNIGKMQTFITCCDPAGLSVFQKCGLFEIEAGRIRSKSR